MPAEMYKLLHAYLFEVNINGAKVGFKSVSGVKLATAFEPLLVGGMNDGAVMLPVPMKDGGKITFERGKYTGAQNNLPKPGETVKDLTVRVYDDAGGGVTYTLEYPAVESVEIGALDALSSEVLIETLTVVFRRMTEKNG